MSINVDEVIKYIEKMASFKKRVITVSDKQYQALIERVKKVHGTHHFRDGFFYKEDVWVRPISAEIRGQRSE